MAGFDPLWRERNQIACERQTVQSQLGAVSAAVTDVDGIVHASEPSADSQFP